MLVYFACLLVSWIGTLLTFPCLIALLCLLASFLLLPFLKPLIAAAPLFPLPRYALVLYYLRYLVSRYFVVKKIIVIRQSRQDEIYIIRQACNKEGSKRVKTAKQQYSNTAIHKRDSGDTADYGTY